MACEIGKNVIVCGPDRSIPAHRHIAWCPLCEKNRRQVTRYDGIYGYTTYCLTCRGREQDGEWRPPFRDKYADEDRIYVNALWASGTNGRTFRAIVKRHEAKYWAAE